MNIKKLIAVPALLLSSLCLFSCSNVKKNSSVTESTVEDSTDASDNNIVELNVRNNTFTELKHTIMRYIELDNYEVKKIDSSVQGIISSVTWLNDKIIMETYPDDENGCVEIGIFDPYNNKYEKKERIPFSAAYGNYTKVLMDRYFVMINANKIDNELSGKVIIYDIEADEIRTIDEYKIHNIVQYITPVGETGIAYYYYESETQDWVVKYYDIKTEESREIFRHTNFNELPMSPVAIANDGNNAVLVIQYIENDVYHTQLAWIDTSSNLYKTEEIDLYNFFGNENYEITDFIIKDNFYYIKANVKNTDEYFIFSRSGNDFHVILPAIRYINKLASYSVNNDSDISFEETDFSNHDIININLSDSSYGTYSLSTQFLSDEMFSFYKLNSDNDLIIFYQKDSSGYKYQIIEDYKSASVSGNTGIYMSPREQYEQYLKEDGITEKDIEEKKKSTMEIEKQMAESDFRWNFVYNNPYYQSYYNE